MRNAVDKRAVAAMDQARALLALALERPAESIPDDASVENFPAWDSLGHMRLLMALEERLGALMEARDIARLKSISDVAVLLSRD
jgi:acyl carrier protein